MANSPTLILYSLNPNVMATKFSGRIVDKIVVSNQADKDVLLTATHEALRGSGVSTISSCFNPRHAVSTSDATVVNICFDCGLAEIEMDGNKHTIPVSRKARPLSEALVRKYHLKTAPPNE